MISATPELSLELRRFPSGVRPQKPGRTGKTITEGKGWGEGKQNRPSPKRGLPLMWEGLSSLSVSWAVQPSGLGGGVEKGRRVSLECGLCNNKSNNWPPAKRYS